MLGSPNLLSDWGEMNLLFVADGEALPFSDERFEVVGMPGHTTGSISFPVRAALNVS